MVAETNGNEDPTVRNLQQRPTGIMKVPLRRSRGLGYHEEALKITTNNIYVWCRLTNIDADYVHTQWPTWWSTANLEFWLAVRLFFILNKAAFDSLFTKVNNAGASYRSLAGVQSWIRTVMTSDQRIGPHSRRDLRRIADHLDDMRKVMHALDGPGFTSERFSQLSIVAPGTDSTKFRTVTAMGAV
jgi:hypothetical protein